jgi:hypothetical protein
MSKPREPSCTFATFNEVTNVTDFPVELRGGSTSVTITVGLQLISAGLLAMLVVRR